MIEIKINQADVDQVRRMLQGLKDVPEKVISRAINKTLSGVRTDASAEIRSIITAKKSAVDDTFRVVKATVNHLSALFESKGRPLPLIEFSARQTQRGVSVQVKRSSPRSVVPGAFIRTMKSGHKGVFWRQWHQKGGKLGKTEQQIARSGYIFNSRTGRYFPAAALPKSYRLPLAERFGPRVPDILSNEPVMAVVLKKADTRLHNNLASELNYELSKL